MTQEAPRLDRRDTGRGDARHGDARRLGRQPWVWAAILMAVSYAVIFLPRGAVHVLAGREMVYETLGAFFFLVASLFFFRCFQASRVVDSAARWRRLAYLLLGLLLFVAFGEELSWGQHLLGFDTPEEIKAINAQDEVNLHNLWLLDSYDPAGGKKRGWRALLNSNRLFDYFMVTLLWLLPFAHARIPALGRLIDRFGGPVVDGRLGWLLALGFFLSVAAELLVVHGDPFLHLAVSETREMGYGLLTALAAADLLARERHLSSKI